MSKPLNIHWSSNASWAPSGYGVQTKLFLPRIKALGHKVSATFWYGLEGGTQQVDGITIYPKGGHPYGEDVSWRNAQDEGAKVLITLIDAWVMEPQNYPPSVRWCPWFPVDMDPIPPPVLRKVAKAFSPICYAKFGVQKCQEAGLNPLYVPHGVDRTVFKPVDRAEVRRQVGWRDDAFIVGMVAANKGYPSRKAFAECLIAFAQFAKRKTDAVLYLHTTMGENGQFGGINLPELAEHLGVREKVLFPDPEKLARGIPDAIINQFYNAFDVLLSPSAGEGFGVPILEAQTAGCPVITGDWTSMSEITKSGWMVSREDATPVYTPLASFQFWPKPEAIEDCLIEAYHARDKRTENAQEVSAKVAEYDVDSVTENYWKPVLNTISERIAMADDAQRRIWGAVSSASDLSGVIA